MKIIVISGSDGSGKSTILNLLNKHFQDILNLTTKLIWKRHLRFLARIFNLVMKISGRNKHENYSWGSIGYHNYDFSLGYVYIILSYIDWIFFLYLEKFKLFFQNKPLDIILYDRNLPDLIADLILATKKDKFIYKLFHNQVKLFMADKDVIIIRCDPKISRERRHDLKDDKILHLRDKCYREFSEIYNIQIIDTSKDTPDMSLKKILSLLAKNES